MRRFDFSAVHQEGGDKEIIAAEARDQIVSKLHHILKPFLLRRLKSDVEKELPKKREYLVYAALTDAQREYYDAIVNRNIRQFLLHKAQGDGAANGGADGDADEAMDAEAADGDEEEDDDTHAPGHGTPAVALGAGTPRAEH